MGKYKVGDRVRVLPLEKISALFYNRSCLPSGVAFPSHMNGYCGEEFRVKEMLVPRHTSEGTVGLYKLGHLNGRTIFWTFTDEMLEDADEINVPLNISMSFEDLLR